MAITFPGMALGPRGADFGLPCAPQLAALGALLCLYHAKGGELSGWAQAVRVESRAALDSDGLRESLMFFDAEGHCCWRLYLLPDSDFVAWDRLIASWPCREEAEASIGVGERLWRRLSGRLRGEQWQARILQLHAVSVPAAQPVLAASLTSVSTLGATTAQRIARAEGAEGNIRPDDCCCAQSAQTAVRSAARFGARDDRALPLIRSGSRKTT